MTLEQLAVATSETTEFAQVKPPHETSHAEEGVTCLRLRLW